MPLDGMEAKGHAAPFSVVVSGGKRLGSEWVTVESAGFSRLNTVFSWRPTIFSHISSGTICEYETHSYTLRCNINPSGSSSKAMQQALGGQMSHVTDTQSEAVLSKNCVGG